MVGRRLSGKVGGRCRKNPLVRAQLQTSERKGRGDASRVSVSAKNADKARRLARRVGSTLDPITAMGWGGF